MLIRENYNHTIIHSDYWQLEINLAIKENKERKNARKRARKKAKKD